MPGKIKLILPSEFHAQVNHLHNIVGAIEWSGSLLYEPKGSIENYENMELRVKGVYPLAKGTSGYVEHTFGDEIIDIHKAADGAKLGWIHTHHNMGAFYSGTDKDDLHINTDNYNYYLTMIVDFKCQPVAWVTWIQEEEIEYVIRKKEKRVRNGSGGWFTFGKNKKKFVPETKTKIVKTLCIAECEIVSEFEGWFIDALTSFEERNKPKPVKYHQPSFNYSYPSDEDAEEAMEILECLLTQDINRKCDKKLYVPQVFQASKIDDISADDRSDYIKYAVDHFAEYAVYSFGYSTKDSLKHIYDVLVKKLDFCSHLPVARELLAEFKKLDIDKINMDDVSASIEEEEAEQYSIQMM